MFLVIVVELGFEYRYFTVIATFKKRNVYLLALTRVVSPYEVYN